MTITVRKAGEALAKTAVTRAGARAVTAAEAPHVAPHRASTKQTMQPWNTWFRNLLREALGEDRYGKLSTTMNFMPDDIYDLHPAPQPAKKIPISKTDPSITAEFRYPSPGSQKPAHVPLFDTNEDPYDSGYFKRDTKRRHFNEELGDKAVEMAKLALMNPKDPSVVEEQGKVAAGRTSSPGNKGMFATGPTTFDPTGLRSTLSVTWPQLEKALDANMPNHLPHPVWEGREPEITAYYQGRGLPVPVGEYYTDLKVPVELRVARW